jgi:hypothetical protein
MRISAHIFTAGPFDAGRADRDEAFAVFGAALDREEAAARALQAGTTAGA